MKKCENENRTESRENVEEEKKLKEEELRKLEVTEQRLKTELHDLKVALAVRHDLLGQTTESKKRKTTALRDRQWSFMQ